MHKNFTPHNSRTFCDSAHIFQSTTSEQYTAAYVQSLQVARPICMDDDIVLHSAALNNMFVWGERIGGYFAKDIEVAVDDVIMEG